MNGVRGVLCALFALLIVMTASSGSWLALSACVVGFLLMAPPYASAAPQAPPQAPPAPVSPPPSPLPARESPWEEYRSWERAVVVEYLAGDLTVYELESELEFYGEAYLIKTKPQTMRMKRKRR